MARQKRLQLQIVGGDSNMKNDKRFFCRFALKDAAIRFKDLRLGDKFEGVCKNISAGGVGVVCPWDVKVKTPVEIWLDCQDGFEPFHILGKVVWSVTREGELRHIGIIFDKPKLMTMSRFLKQQC